jgi:hypothetical protein
MRLSRASRREAPPQARPANGRPGLALCTAHLATLTVQGSSHHSVAEHESSGQKARRVRSQTRNSCSTMRRPPPTAIRLQSSVFAFTDATDQHVREVRNTGAQI